MAVTTWQAQRHESHALSTRSVPCDGREKGTKEIEGQRGEKVGGGREGLKRGWWDDLVEWGVGGGLDGRG